MDLVWEEQTVVCTEYFRMFVFKVQRCFKDHPHDWTACPFAHPTEKARRRDPTRYKYNGTACADYRKNGTCRRGDACPFAHGVFEAWLHPARYRTKICTESGRCTRQTCFFAHSEDQLREPTSEETEEVRQVRDEMLVEVRKTPEYARQLDQLNVLVEIAHGRQQAALAAAAAVAQATPLDLLREIQAPARMPGGRRNARQNPSSNLREYLLGMVALQQEQERLAHSGPRSVSSMTGSDLSQRHGSLSSIETGPLSSRIPSLGSCFPGTEASPVAVHGADTGDGEDWATATTPTALSSRRSSMDTLALNPLPSSELRSMIPGQAASPAQQLPGLGWLQLEEPQGWGSGAGAQFGNLFPSLHSPAHPAQQHFLPSFQDAHQLPAYPHFAGGLPTGLPSTVDETERLLLSQLLSTPGNPFQGPPQAPAWPEPGPLVQPPARHIDGLITSTFMTGSDLSALFQGLHGPPLFGAGSPKEHKAEAFASTPPSAAASSSAHPPAAPSPSTHAFAAAAASLPANDESGTPASMPRNPSVDRMLSRLPSDLAKIMGGQRGRSPP